MEPWQSWLATFAVAGVVYWYYKVPTAIRRPQPVTEEAPRPARRGVEARGRRSRPMAPASHKSEEEEVPAKATSSDIGNSKGRNKKKAQPVPEKTPVVAAQAVDDKEEEVGDKEWAQRLAGLKTGTTLQPTERKDARPKTIKQKAAKAEKSGDSSAGADADDDLSPALSPNLAASSGVADMLEAPAAGPSVLRLTGSTEDKKKQQKAKQEAQAQETKKQRQNRKKVEEAKLQREEDEKARRVLLENQRRTAREARGEAAKNGVVPAPTSNAWASKPAVTSNITSEAPLLDTFEHDRASTTSSSGAGNSNASASTAGTDWKGELPSEEEQVRMAMEDSAWNTVTAKKGKKKTETKDGNTASDAKVNAAVALPISQPEPTETTRSSTMSSDSQPIDVGSLTSSGNLQGTGHPQDSDWAVV